MKILASFLLIFTLFAPLGASAQNAEIEGVITSQIEAFKVDDFAKAFTFAAPNIRGIFRTPDNFGRMVSQGYPMVWRPAEVQYRDLTERGGFSFQNVLITDAQGRVFLLEYSMVETSEGWKIAGVRILENAAISA